MNEGYKIYLLLKMRVIRLIIYLNLFFLKEIQNVIINLRNFLLRNKIVKNYIFTLFSQRKRNIFFDENINNYIKTNSLIWPQKKTNNSSKILIESLINHPHYLIPNCIVGKKLSLINKCDCVGIIKKGDIISKEIMSSFGINEIIENRDGKYLFKIKNKVACVVSFLDGKDKKNLNLKNCYDIGKTVAQMHSSSKKIRLFRKNSMNIKNLNPLLKSIKFKSKKFINLEKFLKSNFREIKNKWPKKLPNGIIHGDLFIDNIFFKKNKISGIIDFYFAANDYFMYEIAICINALCFDKKNSQFKLNKKKVKNLIRGYEGIKKISGIEKKSLNILCRAAAIRYFLTRLYDYTNTPKTALIKIKDPREYYQKLIIHNNLKNYRDYLV